MTSGFLIRDIAPEDLDDLRKAAVHLDSVNLPDNRDALAQIIERSRRSFAAIASGAAEPPAKDRCLVFVAAALDGGGVVGTSMIFPQHGSRKAPHVQELIGQVGPETKAVEKVLREIGFSYAHRIDPFDGGPHFHARTDDITLVRATRTARCLLYTSPSPRDS